MAGSSFLQVDGLSMRFGGLLAVDGIAFDVKEREIFAIIGPNGAGKTTVFNCISGFYRPTTAPSACRDGTSPARAATAWRCTAWCEPSRTCACSST